MNERVAAMLRLYDAKLSIFPIKEFTDDTQPFTITARLSHIRWMIAQMLNPTEHHLDEKFRNPVVLNRWMGFVHGVLWNEKIFSITELRAHTRGLYPEAPLAPAK